MGLTKSLVCLAALISSVGLIQGPVAMAQDYESSADFRLMRQDRWDHNRGDSWGDPDATRPGWGDPDTTRPGWGDPDTTRPGWGDPDRPNPPARPNYNRPPQHDARPNRPERPNGNWQNSRPNSNWDKDGRPEWDRNNVHHQREEAHRPRRF